VIEAAHGCLEKTENDRVKARAADTLRALGQQASPLGALEALSEHDPAENVRKRPRRPSRSGAARRAGGTGPPARGAQKMRTRTVRSRTIDRTTAKMPVKTGWRERRRRAPGQLVVQVGHAIRGGGWVLRCE
jgi:hypothetical protein